MAKKQPYMTESELNDFIDNNEDYKAKTKIRNNFNDLISTSTNGIEGMPYQFMESVDRRIDGTNVGRKYADKIFARMPLLFLTPCEPLFMDDFDKKGKNAALNDLIGVSSDAKSMVNTKGKYYSVEFNYAEYYRYLNAMLASVCVFMGIQDKKINFANTGNMKRLIDIDWSDELNSSYKTFWSSKENVVFYLDGLSSISESFSNETTESSLAGTVNQISDQLNELRFLFGKNDKNLASMIEQGGTALAESISAGLGSTGEKLAGGILGSVLENSPFLKGGKIVFPKIWSNSSFDRSYQLDIKLRSPDNDNLSIFLNIIKPYCKILALTLPRALKENKKGISDPNSYRSPFLVKAAVKGMFNIDMGIITSLSVTKGDKCQWNDDGLPTQIDISISIEDLYSSMHMTSFGKKLLPVCDLLGGNHSVASIACNTSYMDYLANLSGLNIAQEEPYRRTKMFYYLSQAYITQTGSRVMTMLDQEISKKVALLWKL